MDFKKFFSWVPKDRAVASKHEFHFIFFREPLDISRYTAWDEENNVIEPKEIPDPVEPNYLHWQDWFYSKVFCEAFWEEDEKGNFKTEDYSNDKRQHIEDFLDFHYNRFVGQPILFLDAIANFMLLSKHHKVFEVIPPKKFEAYTQMVQEWVLQKKNLAVAFSGPKKIKTIDLKTYKWQSKHADELLELYNLMLTKYKLIDQDTTLEQFRAVFTGQSVELISPVKWHKDNASELLYFVLKLSESHNIPNKKRTDYLQLKACFVRPDGKPFEANFKELKQNIEINLSSELKSAIDELLKQF